MGEKLKQVKVYFSPIDHEKLKSEADRKNVSLAELIRQKINLKIENAPAPRKTKKVYKQTDPKLLFELNKIGNNLNQIAKKLNKGDTVSNMAVLQELVVLEKKLSELL